MINTYTIFPSRKSVRFIVSELFAETCHTIPQSLVWRLHVGFPPKSTNTAAWNQQEHLKNFRWKRFLFVRELNYLSLIMSSNGWLAKNHKVGVTHSENSKLQNAVFWKWQTRRGLGGKKNYRIPVHYFILEAAISEEHMQVSGPVFCNSARFTTR